MSIKKIDDIMENVVMSDALKDRIRNQTTHKEKYIALKRPNFKKTILAACLSVALLGTMTAVAANNLDKIESVFANLLGLDEEEQQKLINSGYVHDLTQATGEDDIVSVTKEGITVSIKQTIADKNTLKILLHVKSENGIKLSDYCFFENVNYICEENDKQWNISTPGGIMANNSPYEQWYMIEVQGFNGTDGIEGVEFNTGDTAELVLSNLMETVSSEGTLSGETMQTLEHGKNITINGVEYNVYQADNVEDLSENTIARMNNYSIVTGKDNKQYFLVPVEDDTCEAPGSSMTVTLSDDGCTYAGGDESAPEEKVVAKAEWRLTWKITAGEDQVVLPINETIQENGYEYYLNSIELSPFSFSLIFDKRANVLDEEYIINNCEMSIDEKIAMLYNKANNFSTEPPYIPLDIQIVMKDKTIRNITDTVYSYSIGAEGQEYKFIEMLDLNNIEKIMIEGKEYHVN